MPYELIPMAVAFVATLLFAAQWHRAGLRLRDTIGAALILFAGLTVAGSMLVHDGEILANKLRGVEPPAEFAYRTPPKAPVAHVLGVTYDFRFYSLLLFGTLLLVQSALLARVSVRVAFGCPVARQAAWRRIGLLLLIVGPLLPMSILAVAVTALLALAAGGLLMAKPASALSDGNVRPAGMVASWATGDRYSPAMSASGPVESPNWSSFTPMRSRRET